MDAQEIRQAYLNFFKERGHTAIPRALLVPQNDPTTLFTGSGMQPLIPYLLGQPHPAGKRLVDSQPSLRAQDIEEVGDNRHTTFFEMLGNWSLGDYFKEEQLAQFWEFLTDVLKLDAERIYVSVFAGDDKNKIPKDTESADIWKKLFGAKGIEALDIELGSAKNGGDKGMQGGRIFYYDSKENWWSRTGIPDNMPAGEPGGPDSEVFYLFPAVKHDEKYGKHCHPACDCGRFIEMGNSVFMQYVRNDKGGFDELPQRNVDYGGGLERIAAAVMDSPDVFKISLMWPIIEALQELSGKKYSDHTTSMRVIADHLRGAAFLAVDGVVPSNKEQGYVMRRLVRRAIRYGFELGIEQNFMEHVVPVIADLYHDDFPEVAEKRRQVISILSREEQIFRQTLRSGVIKLEKMAQNKMSLTGIDIFRLYDTYGFPPELLHEEASRLGIKVHHGWRSAFDAEMKKQKERSQTAGKGVFKGGLADHSEQVVKYHTTTHLMYKALKEVLGDHVIQRGSNITAERTRFDFSHPQKMTPEEINRVEDIVNEKIQEDLPVSWKEENTKQALADGVSGAFGDKYGERVKVYTIGNPNKPFSREICGGPHVEHTGQIGEGSKKFKIVKEEASSAGIRRVKAVLQ